MCGGSGRDTGSSGPSAKDYSRTAGMMGSLGGMFTSSMQSHNPGAFNNSAQPSAPVATTAQPAKTTMGAPNPQQTVGSRTGTVAPFSKARMTSVFGPAGIGAIKETEEAFEGGTISTPEGYGWDFTKGRPKNGEPSWDPNRQEGAIRDAVAKAIGRPYDRTATPSRANSMLAKGPGILSTWAEGLKEGNYHYDDEGKPAVDTLGMVTDIAKPMGSLAYGNILGAIWGGAKAIDTLKDHNTLKNAGVFGAPQTKAPAVPTAQRTVAARPSATGFNPVSGMMGEDDGRRLLFVSKGATEVTTTLPEEKKSAVTKSTRVPRGRSSLILTSSRGLEGTPRTLLRSLFGGNPQTQ